MCIMWVTDSFHSHTPDKLPPQHPLHSPPHHKRIWPAFSAASSSILGGDDERLLRNSDDCCEASRHTQLIRRIQNMASSVAGSVTTVLACRSRPTRRRLSLLPLLLLAVFLLSARLPGVHAARALRVGDGKEGKVAEAGDQMTTTHAAAAAARWSVTVREGGGGGGHGSGHAGAGHGHGSGHGRPEPAEHHQGRRSAAPGAEQPPMAASCAAFLAAVALLRF
uniref:Uncharacterized protein n=1 Tax=Oryza punctata TaxID=4537 RepID=A0A0E0LJ16_ORYPU